MYSKTSWTSKSKLKLCCIFHKPLGLEVFFSFHSDVSNFCLWTFRDAEFFILSTFRRSTRLENPGWRVWVDFPKILGLWRLKNVEGVTYNFSFFIAFLLKKKYFWVSCLIPLYQSQPLQFSSRYVSQLRSFVFSQRIETTKQTSFGK